MSTRTGRALEADIQRAYDIQARAAITVSIHTLLPGCSTVDHFIMNRVVPVPRVLASVRTYQVV